MSRPTVSIPGWTRADARARIVEARGLTTMSVFWVDKVPPPNLARLVTIAIPYSQAFSKNALYKTARRHVYISERTRLAARLVTALVSGESKKAGVSWAQRKTYLSIFVEKPFHNSDAINVVDVLADAVKHAIGVDDTREGWRVKRPRIDALVLGSRTALVEQKSPAVWQELRPVMRDGVLGGTKCGRRCRRAT